MKKKTREIQNLLFYREINPDNNQIQTNQHNHHQQHQQQHHHQQL